MIVEVILFTNLARSRAWHVYTIFCANMFWHTIWTKMPPKCTEKHEGISQSQEKSSFTVRRD